MSGTSMDVNFGRCYGLLSVLTQGGFLVALLVSRPLPEDLGALVCSPAFLCALAAAVLAWVVLAKRLSGHGRALSLPEYCDPVRGDPSRGPLLRRLVLRAKRLVFKLRPLRRLAGAAAVLMVFWAAAAYLSVCFGAPAFSAHRETASFSALVTILAVLPAVLVYGPETSALHRVFLESDLRDVDPLANLLFQNAMGVVVGSWFGAFPIPLDWDRPWQDWPITCCLGAVAGHAVSSLWSLFIISRQHSRYFSILLI